MSQHIRRAIEANTKLDWEHNKTPPKKTSCKQEVKKARQPKSKSPRKMNMVTKWEWEEADDYKTNKSESRKKKGSIYGQRVSRVYEGSKEA